MTDHKPLDAFTDEYGTTDDARENVELSPPDDGHVRREHRVDDYWHGLTEVLDKTHPAYSIIPPGNVRIVLDSDPELASPSYGRDEPLDRGVYLDGRAEVGRKPPAPVEVDDDYLRFAAGAALYAVDEVADPDDEIAVVSMNSLSVSFAVRGMDRGEQEYLVDTSPDPIVYPDERPDELFYGFTTIRRFGTPYDVYTRAEVPRLGLEDLDVEWPRTDTRSQ